MQKINDGRSQVFSPSPEDMDFHFAPPTKSWFARFWPASEVVAPVDDDHDCHLTPYGEDGCDNPVHTRELLESKWL